MSLNLPCFRIVLKVTIGKLMNKEPLCVPNVRVMVIVKPVTERPESAA